ncbi:TPA: SPH_0224 family bacteriocin-like peptide [Streptococcus pneumoniae]|uniref:SPH_0224 family bacteriocin-like peptide n=1 Tax=Streptococcus pneumoniae TaxID=1313 RepID=UPI0010D6B7F2|nr:SPH_0224 family bacteriocin-like peptide [Streptococcus pneumoniae]MBW5014328.1 SPH_0224 family bacteriocin-like peptide [Streptococcus pneumoniae]MDG7949918.1 SPH_0224 family bacteriocin-like peptide [Streptococcus pneumoniae]MDG8940273.1 SPH_0224 family bacteriocin-like peptide [Streptococcus pneumoniae]MDG9580855.1 SPH_0224 family bacteriocin-like peptide [Streptococcus pneumoniae]MDG9585030.1 SPH_0224 family bacteriocin-like peptide [Streptococcus pneumoniae]
MELVLPNNYVVLEQEEMMYLDGGFSIPRWPVATAINIAFNGVLGGGAISLVRNYIRNYGLRRVTSAIAGAAARYVGVRVANRVAGFALSAINGFAAWMSIGDAITTIWANNDVNRRDPNLNVLW